MSVHFVRNGSAAAAFAAALVVTASPAFGDIVSTFDDGDEGWLIFGDAQGGSVTPDWSASDGNPGGHISAVDNVAGGVWYFLAPEKFLGDRTSSYDQTLSFDLAQTISGSPNPFSSSDIVLVGSGVTITYSLPQHPAYGEWTSYAVELNEAAGWTIGGTGQAATQADILAALGNLTALRIRGEYQSGPDTGSLDNVILGQIPAPGAAALFAVALCAARRRRRATTIAAR